MSFVNILAVRSILPAKDLEASRRFYDALGFSCSAIGDGILEMRSGALSFLLKDHYRHDWADGLIMHALVDHLQDWWIRIGLLRLAETYGVRPPRPPVLEPWGQYVGYVYDPSGVTWHFAELARRAPEPPWPAARPLRPLAIRRPAPSREPAEAARVGALSLIG